MKRRRVLLLLSEAFVNGGIQRFNRTLMAACGSLELDCEVFALNDTPEARARWPAADPRLRVRTFARHKAAFAVATLRAIATGRYDDVIVGHVNFLTLVAGARLLRRDLRLMMVAHGTEVWDRLRGMRRRALARVDRILCVSEYTAQSLRRQAPGIPAERFTVFPNALADLWVEQARRLATAGSAREDRFILSVGRLSRHDRRKGIITTLEAFAKLEDRGLRYVIAGDGDDRPYLEQLAARLGIAERVDFLGAVSDSELVGLYRHCQLFVLPSSQEGFGIVYLEAMFFGAPVIAAREKGVLDVVRDGETGLLVGHDDVAGLQAAITRMLGDELLRARLRHAARAQVTQDGRFTAAAFSRRLAALLAGERPRKLVFVNRYFAPDESATSRMVSDLARLLRGSGHTVVVVTSRQLYDDADADLSAYEEIDGIVVHRVSGARRGRGKLAGRALDYLSFHWTAYWRLRRLLAAGDIVVAKTDPPMLGVSVGLAARARGARLVNWLQDLFPEVAAQLGVALRPEWLARALVALRNQSLRLAACNVAIGVRMAERLEAQGVRADSIRIIPNWADVAEITAREVGGNPVRARLGIVDRFVIGYSGNLGRAHEFDTFLGAARLLHDSPDFVFLITGGGARLPALRAAVSAEGLQNFHFQALQPADCLDDNMAAADVHLVSLLPSTEGLIVPSKYYGIMAAGRPAIFIGDPDGELAREIRANDTGVVVAVGDAESLANELRSLRGDPERLAQVGANARRAAEQSYSSARALKSWLSLIGSLDPRTTEPRQSPSVIHAQSGA